MRYMRKADCCCTRGSAWSSSCEKCPSNGTSNFFFLSNSCNSKNVLFFKGEYLELCPYKSGFNILGLGLIYFF